MKQIEKTKEFLKKFKRKDFRTKVLIIIITIIFIISTFLPYFFI